jgi:hypothetical protein
MLDGVNRLSQDRHIFAVPCCATEPGAVFDGGATIFRRNTE